MEHEALLNQVDSGLRKELHDRVPPILATVGRHAIRWRYPGLGRQLFVFALSACGLVRKKEGFSKHPRSEASDLLTFVTRSS
jgi:hypothetical protein